MTKYLPLLCILLFSFSVNGHAKEIKAQSLNKNVIKNFVETTTNLTRGITNGNDPHEVEDFLHTHIHDEARFKTAITYNMPGQAGHENHVKFTKKEYIQHIVSGSDKVDEYNIGVSVESIKFSKDKRVATAKTKSLEEAYVYIPGSQQNDAQKVPILGTTLCTQVLKLNKKDILQMYHADCETMVEFAGL